MRVARLYGVGDIRVSDEPVPPVEPATALVRVTAVGLCGSDLHWFTDGGIGDATLDHPLVLGHEFAGVIASGARAGQRVAVDPAVTCGCCPLCRAGHPNLCPSVQFAGHSPHDGGLREFLAWPEELLHPLPDALSDADGALLEPLGITIHAVDLAHLRVGMSVAVVGCGPIGLLLVQLARVAGATSVIAADPLAHRRDAATRLGADQVWDPTAGPAPVDGLGVDVAFEAAGTDPAVDTALQVARPGARVLLLGIPGDDRITVTASLARRKGLTLVMVRRMKEVYPRAIDLVAGGLVDTASLATAAYPLEQAPRAFAAAATRAGLKTVVTSGEER